MFEKSGRGLITWQELSSLLKALGIPDIATGMLNRMSIAHTPDNSPGLEYKPFLNLLHSDSFSSTLDYTYNRHNSTYNVRVIKKSISLLVDGFLTFGTLRAARLGFTLYEGETCTGLTLDAPVLCSALRVSGLSIAPKKLSSWLTSIEEDVPGRLQLYEFLDLVKLCSDRLEQTKSVPAVSTSVERSRVGLFELTDANFLLTPGQKLGKHMDEDYDNTVSLVNLQQLPPRESLTSSTKKSSSPEFNNNTNSRNSKRVEEGLDLYGQIRGSLVTSTSYVQNARTNQSSGATSRSLSTRPHSVADNHKSKLPSLQLSSSFHSPNRRSASAPSMRSVDSQRSTKIDSEGNHDGREPLPRHMTASAPLMRGFSKDKTDAFDEGEFALPERRLERYETLRDYIAVNGEASLSRIVTSSIGASHRQPIHLSPPSSPHLGKMEERKKKVKQPKRAEESRRNTRNAQKGFSVDSLANNLEDIINSNKPYAMGDLTKAPSTRKPSMHLNDDVDIDLPSALVVSSSTAEGHTITRPARPRTESPARSITFNLNPAGI